MSEIAEIADRLYALPAQEFTTARDAAAKEAKGADAQLAAAVKALKRPSASAWLVNQLARQRPDRLDELLDLGDQLRAAQDALSGDELRRLNTERHRLLRAVAGEAAQFADKVGDAIAREVELTLDAALADPDAGAAVRTGRLVRALSGGGFDAVDLTGAVAVPDAPAAPRPARTTRKPAAAPAKKSPAPRRETAKDKAAAAKARRELAAARREVEQLNAQLGERDEGLTAARDRVDTARAQLDELESALKAARAERSAAEKELERAQRERNAAARTQRNAQQRLDKLSG